MTIEYKDLQNILNAVEGFREDEDPECLYERLEIIETATLAIIERVFLNDD